MSKRIPHGDIRDTIMRMMEAREAPKTVCPSEVARAIAGQDEKVWRLMMQPIRRAALELAAEGMLTIYRKGRPVESPDFKGIYRIGHPSGGGQ